MSDLSRLIAELPPEQQAIRAKCFHPSGVSVEFKKEEIEQSIPDRFEQQVAKYPDRIAVKTRNYMLTYDALNQMANRVARTILALRGDGEEPIALLLEHDAPMIAAILGVLKAGKIYVPIDPANPQLRIAYLLGDSQARLIATDTRNFSIAREASHNQSPLLNIDEIDSSYSTENLGLYISPDSLAYIRYTSGSTGQAKGVMEKHRNLLHVIMRQTNAFRICADDRLIFLGSWGKHIFRGLLNGAALYPANVKEEGLAHLSKWLADEEITIYHSIPSVFRHFIDTLTGQETFPRLRMIRLAGEAVARKDIELFKKYFSPKCILVNELGSTEAGTIAHYIIDKKTQITTNIVPVGYAVEDIKILLLDEGKKVGFNEIGEIAVKSRYLSPGYWRRPDLISAAFLPDPEGGDERIYLTGDEGFMRSDGCLVHLGRKDFQSKIRGNRVEMAEIEMVLLHHADIKEAVVMAREDKHGDLRLVAYLVPTSPSLPTAGELRSFLKEKLPDYMVPSAFVFLNALPLTPNGKINRGVLPAPDPSQPGLERIFVAPRDPLEFQLAKIWEKTLGVQPIGVSDNFFELGGHSLLAMKLLAQIEKDLGKQLPPGTLFHAPTVEALARIIPQQGWSPPSYLVIPLKHRGSKPPFFCHGASTELARHVDSDQPIYALEPHGLDGRRASSTVEVMAADYIREIKTLQPAGPYWLGGYSFGGMVALEMAQQLKKQGQEVELLVLLDPARLQPPVSPSPSNSLANITQFRDEVSRHLRNLALLAPREKLNYVLQRAGWRIVGIIEEIKKKIKKTICNFSLSIGNSVPPILRMFYFSEVTNRAARKYVPQAYTGRVVLFKAKERPYDPGADWSRLAAGGLEVHELPGGHLDVIRGPHVQIWAKQLSFCLRKALATESGQ